MTDSSTSQSNPIFLPEAESSAIPLGLHNPLLTPDALGQGKFSASLIPLGSRRITVLDPSFFQRKPILQEGSELYDSDFFSVDTVKSHNAPESLISSSYSSKIQRSSLPKIQSQESLSLISNLDQNSSLSKSSIDSSDLISDSTSLSNIDSSEFQSSLPANNLQLKREEDSSQISHTAQRKSVFSTSSSNNLLDITSLDQDLSHSVESVEIKPDLKISDQPVQRSSIKEVSDSTQNTIKSQSVIQSNKSDIEDSRISSPVSVEQVELFPSSSTIDLQFKLEVEELVQTPIAIESANQTSEQQIQRFSATQDSNIVQTQIDSFQPEPQSVNSAVGIDRQSITIQRATSSESTVQDFPTQFLSNTDIQSKLESFDQTYNLIQRYQDIPTSSQINSGEDVSIEPVNRITEQQVQRFSTTEDSNPLPMQTNSLQPKYRSSDSQIKLDRQSTPIQRATSSESTVQGSPTQPSSNVDIQFRQESEEPNVIQKHPETNIHSQPDSGKAISIEPTNQNAEQQFQRFSATEDSEDHNVTQKQIDSFQPEPRSVNSAVGIDRQSAPIQRTTSSESINQGSPTQSSSNVEIQFRQEAKEPNFIQKHPETDIYSQPDFGEAISIEPVNQTTKQQVQRFSAIEDSTSVQRQIDLSQLVENKSLNSPVRVDQQFTQIQRSTSSESTNQDLLIQLSSNIDTQSKLESEELNQISNLIQKNQESNTSSQPDSNIVIAIESIPNTSNQEIRRFSIIEDSSPTRSETDSSQLEHSSVNSAMEIDEEFTRIQRSTSTESINKDLSIQLPSNIDIQSELVNQSSSLIQRYQEAVTSSQPNSGEVIAIELTNHTIEQQIQRLSATEDSNSSQVQIDSPQPEQQSLSPGMEIDQQVTLIQRSTSTESTKQDLSIQPPSNIDIQSKLESESFDQNSSLIQRYQEIPPSSQPNAGSIAIEPANQSTEQQIQRLLTTEYSKDPNVIQRQIDSFQPEQQQVNSVVGRDREPTQIQRSTIAPYLIQDLEQSITKLEDTGSPSIDAIGPEEKRLDRTIQRSSTIDSSDVDKTRVNISKSVDHEVSSWIKNDRHSIESKPLNSLPSEDKGLYSQLSTSTDLQFKLEPDALNLLPNLIQKSQESPSSSPTYSNISAASDILEISNDRIDVISPKSENHISNQPIQKSLAIEVADQMSIGSSHLDIQSVSLIDESSASIDKSLRSNTIKRTQEPSSYKAQSIDSDFPIENFFKKSPNEPTSSINISIHDDITIDRDYIQRSSLSESQSEQPESSAISQQPEIEKLPNVLKDISILKPLIQLGLQRSVLDTSNTPRKLDPEPLNIWSTILQPRPQSHSPSSKTDRINSSSHSESSDNYHVINPSSPYNLNAKSDISVVMNSPQEWSSLESLVQMKSEPQKETLQKKSSESYPQIVSSQSTSNHNSSNQSMASRQEIFIQRNASPFSSSVESDQKYVEINSDRNPKFDREKIAKSEHFEALAQEIYLLLRQRLVIDQERQGSGYSGRLPW